MTDQTIPLLHEMNARGRRIAEAYFEAGRREGYARGRADENELIGALQRQAAGIARAVAKAGPYADLAEKRGEPERAERQRAILRDRGIQ